MKRKSKFSSILFLLSLVSLIGITSCAKKEEPAPPMPPPPSSQQMPMGMPQQMPDMAGHNDVQMPKAEDMKVIVPDNIKAKWKAVRLTVRDKETNSAKEYTIALHSKLAVPGTKIEVQTGDFLPDLKIDGNIYATESHDLLNPAVQVFVTENGKEIFKGWLFQKFPDIHPLKHQKFAITLKEPLTSL